MAKRDSVKILKEKISILKQAKKSISSGYDKYICIAIDYASNGDYYTKTELLNYISKSLRNYAFYESWYESKFKKEISYAQAKKNRVKWLNWMIKCLKEDLANK